MKERMLEDLFHDTLKDIYYAERKILRALPKMARAAQSPDLQGAFEHHRQETQEQIERLQEVFEAIGRNPRGKTCPAIDGIIEEAEEIMDEYKGSKALDAGLISSAQAVEHYEITRYGTLRRWAQELGNSKAEKLLAQTLDEEARTDALLTKIADAGANAEAA
ncbi:ferritin-like domain-containing protein [Camelimonas fluminis]|uniref:Ferritin-like domain-containing protein n=2 Tax=Camelimonas fluminis TaxID=1576911 RepID=A0ABV7UC95_9HYPH